MKISELSILEIKALLYDSIIERERVLHNIKMLERELAEKQKQEETVRDKDE